MKLVQKKYNAAVKTISGKLLATTELSKVMIPVGTRVIAIFHDDISNHYYSGIIAETPKSINKYRSEFLKISLIDLFVRNNNGKLYHVRILQVMYRYS